MIRSAKVGPLSLLAFTGVHGRLCLRAELGPLAAYAGWVAWPCPVSGLHRTTRTAYLQLLWRGGPLARTTIM